MNTTKNIISLLLTACMLLTMLVGIVSLDVFAADDSSSGEGDISKTVNEYITKEFNTPEEKLATMKKRLSKDGYELYVDELTGEVATKNIVTGEVLFSNPYDVATEGAVSSPSTTTPTLLSQIIVTYKDSEDNEKTMNSFTEAALRGQITVKNIKNGVRVEYIIGRMETKYLVPRMITEERFMEYIYEPLLEAVDQKLMSEWDLEKWFTNDTNTKGMYRRQDPEKNQSVLNIYPIIEKVGVIYVYNGETTRELTKAEQFIKAFCEDYTYEEMEKDHLMCEYKEQDKNPPNFKMALEYTLDSKGVSVTLPASGIRFNQSLYTLESISVLPYMGCGAYSKQTPNDGYVFFPDGSGTIFEFDELSAEASNLSVGGTVYGADYAYQTLTGGTHQETIRYPVFGVAEDCKATKTSGMTSTTIDKDSRGFLAIIEDGDSLASITAASGGATHKYYNVEMKFYPRPKDTYILSDTASVGSTNEWTVISSRKYTGNYTIRYIMLSDEKWKDIKTDYYDASWLGMAEAYRDYLIDKNVLTPLSEDDVNEDIPLYIESFGAMKTTEKIMSVPVEVMTPMTTFDDIETMYETLKDHGVDNVNFRLTGFANGGMYSKVPYKLKWESKVGGNSGFEDLIDYANDVNENSDGHLGIYPDFDFSYIKNTGLFDGLSKKKHAVKTIDNRYSNKRYYSATKQTYISFFELAISPAYFDHFYTKLTEKYLKYSQTGDGTDLGISISSLGTDLNSDFDEKEPYNREDTKDFAISAFEYFDDNYGSVMTDGANAYAWKYVDYILNMPLTSSRYLQSSAAVPFMGTVLHGFIQYAGAPINMEGNTNYALLKAIENGASIYVTLSYRNTDILKEDEYYNKYYSIMYNIWVGEVNDDGVFEEGELIELYKKLNEALKDLQTSNIIGHEFVIGTRIPTDDERSSDVDYINDLIASQRKAYETERAKNISSMTLSGFLATTDEASAAASDAGTLINDDVLNLYEALAAKLEAYNNASDDAKETALAELEAAYKNYSLGATALLKALKPAYNIYLAYQKVTEDGANYSSTFVADITAKYDLVKDVVKYYKVYDESGDIIERYGEKDMSLYETQLANKYVIKDKTIVKVTYGKDGIAQKTFFLNYNYFDVEIEYNGEKITIEAYGFQVR